MGKWTNDIIIELFVLDMLFQSSRKLMIACFITEQPHLFVETIQA